MVKYKSPKALDQLESALKRRMRDTRLRKYTYSVPSLWSSLRSAPRAVKVNPYAYYLGVVKKLKAAKAPKRPAPRGGEWSRDAVIYNVFVRTTAAFDHNGNGELDLPLNSEGFRETGTFLKAMAMLPYIKRLGANTVHLLPITSIGHDGNKGSLGSPYAIRNPYELDENLGEPSLGLDIKTECKAFVEAAHRLGLRVVLEFVFRTAAKDGDWVKEHPEWLYWIKESIPQRASHETDEHKYGSPLFTHDELAQIHKDVEAKKLDSLTPPHRVYREFFTEPPKPEMVKKEEGRYIGQLSDGTRLRIPGAFADWPPDDNQPPWGDVTYLRMYTHPDFNYIGYNTIRMYDSRLTRAEYINRPLWDRIVGIIPYYQREFGIDGVMIDMGHALPMELKAEMVKKARGLDPDFAFWDENFSVTQKSRDEGYNAVFGYTIFDEHHPDRMRAFCQNRAKDEFPIPFFATPENHNTPRAASRPGGVAYSRFTAVINAFLPGIPFLHSGYELAERYPINTGLDFTSEQIRSFPSEKLPLFSEGRYDWLSKEQFAALIAKVQAIRKHYRPIIVQSAPESVKMLAEGNSRVLSFARIAPKGKQRLAFVGNMDYAATQMSKTKLDTKKKQVIDLLTGKRLKLVHGVLRVALSPGDCLVFEY